MQQLFLVAAIICFGMAAIKFLTARMTPNHAPAPKAPPEKKPRGDVLSPEEAKRRMEENDAALVLDVRTQEEYDQGHIPGAVLLPVGTIDEDTAAEVIPEKDSTVLVYCRSGNRSKTASSALAELGYTNIYEFGGINTWPYEIES